MEHVFASIDIGSDSIKVIVCELYHGRIFLLAGSNVPSSGIKKGLIIDADKAKESIENALREAESMLGMKIKKVICTVPSHFLNYKVIAGSCRVSGKLVTGEDMVNSYKDGIKKNLSINDEFVCAIPVDFKLDGKTVLESPQNYPCDVLEGRAMMISCPKKNIYSVATIIEEIGVELVDVSVSSVSMMSALKNERLLSDMSAIINIGADMTELAIYKRGIPAITKIIGIGGNDIDREISSNFRLTLKDARKIKEEFGVSYLPHASKSDYMKFQNKASKEIKITQAEVSKIISSKIEEILNLAKDELKSLTKQKLKYIMVTGGVSNTSDFEYTLKKILPISHIGKVNLVGVRSNDTTVAIGNIIYFSDMLKLKGKDYSMFSENEMDMLSSPNDNSNTVLGKVFSYFFGE